MSIRHFNPASIADRAERRRFRWTLWALLASFALIFLVSCGEGPESGPTSPTATSTPAVPRVIQQGTFNLAAPRDDYVNFRLITVSTSSAGRWEATVDWSSEANTLWMWVAEGTCTATQFANPECPHEATCPCRFAVISEISTPKPRVLTIPDASSGTRTLIVANLGPREETGQYRVTLTSSSVSTGVTGHAVGPAESTSVSSAIKAGLRRK